MSLYVQPSWQVAPWGPVRQEEFMCTISQFFRLSSHDLWAVTLIILFHQPLMALTTSLLIRMHKVLLALCAYYIIFRTYNRHYSILLNEGLNRHTERTTCWKDSLTPQMPQKWQKKKSLNGSKQHLERKFWIKSTSPGNRSLVQILILAFTWPWASHFHSPDIRFIYKMRCWTVECLGSFPSLALFDSTKNIHCRIYFYYSFSPLVNLYSFYPHCVFRLGWMKQRTSR